MSMERLAEMLQKRGLEGDKDLAEELRQNAKRQGDITVEDFGNFSTQERSLVPVVPETGLVLQVAGRSIRAAEFQFNEHTPKFIQAFYSRFWEIAGEQVGKKLESLN